MTAPLLPCLFGHILDSTSGKSLVFHKYVFHGINSLQPFYEKLGVTQPEKLQVSLYGCEMSEEKFREHKQYYQRITQTKELLNVKKFFKDTLHIPEENIELRFFRNNLTIPIIGEYQNVTTTIGITKIEDIFHTSITAEDIFELENVKLPSIPNQNESVGLSRWKLSFMRSVDPIAI